MADELGELEREIASLREQIADLTRRERHCQNIRGMLDELRQEYLSLAQAAPDAIVATDSDGFVVFYNVAARNLFGHEPFEIVGKKVTALIPKGFHGIHEDGFARIKEHGGALKDRGPSECTALKRDGSEFPIEITHSSWKRGQNVYFAVFIRDITERKRYEKLREDVERVIRHDLKSPLLGIVGFAKLLLDEGRLSGKERQWVSLIYDSGMQMDTLLTNSPAMLRIHEGLYRISPQSVDLARLLEDLGKRFEPALREKSLGFSCNVDMAGYSGEDCTLLGEESFLDDMLSNLIKNAVEASPEGETVRVSVSHGIDHVLIDIHNKGVIPSHIHDSFFQAYVTSGKEGGTGLGAHSAQLIARAHDGEISFTTDEVAGTHMVVRLPKAGSQG